MVQEAIPLDAPIPDDPVELQRLIRQLRCLIHELLSTVQERDREVAGLQHRLEQLLRRLYGPRSERCDPNQPTLFDDCPSPTAPPTPTQPTEPETPTPGHKKKGHGRKRLPKDLKRVVKKHPIPEAEKLCPCCRQPRVQIGEETSEQLDYVPASLQVLVHIRPTLACPDCLRKRELPPAAPPTEEPVSPQPTAGSPAPASPVAGESAHSLSVGAEAASSQPVGEQLTISPLVDGATVSPLTITLSSLLPHATLELRPSPPFATFEWPLTLLPLPSELPPTLPWLPSAPAPLATVDLNKLPAGALFFTAPLPKQPIPKGLPAPGLLAYIIVSKFADHLPLYRIERILAREGGDVSRKTMSGWLAACAALFTPLYELMKQRVLQSRVIHNDDTPVPVLAPKTGKTKTGRLWVSVGDAAYPYNVFNYTDNRSRDGPLDFFKGYKAFLQVDAYSGYECLFTTGDIWEAACWAHVRRYFFEAKTTDAGRSHEMLALIRGLYQVEDEVEELADEASIVDYRREHARPLLAKILKWLKVHKKQVLPKSPMGEAIGYALNNWKALTRYTRFGFLAIDNNVAERALRTVAIGRKNWLFAGSDAAGQTAAVLYSLLSTCQRHGIEPWAYLRDALTRLPELPAERLAELLPDVWAKTQRAQSEVAA